MQYERIRVRWILTLAARLPEGDRVREAAFDAVLKRRRSTQSSRGTVDA